MHYERSMQLLANIVRISDKGDGKTEQVRRLLELGFKPEELVRDFGLDESLVSYVVNKDRKTGKKTLVQLQNIQWFATERSEEDLPDRVTINSLATATMELARRYEAVPVAYDYVDNGVRGRVVNKMLTSGASFDEKRRYVSDIVQRNGGTGCYGSGSEPCLNFCTGCDAVPKKGFDSAKDMYENLQKRGHLYNTATKQFIFLCGGGDIGTYSNVSETLAKAYAQSIDAQGGNSVIGPCTEIHDYTEIVGLNVSDIEHFLSGIYSKDGWKSFDRIQKINKANEMVQKNAPDKNVCEWIVTSYGRNSRNTSAELVVGTAMQVSEYLKEKAGANDVVTRDDGTLLASAKHVTGYVAQKKSEVTRVILGEGKKNLPCDYEDTSREDILKGRIVVNTYC